MMKRGVRARDLQGTEKEVSEGALRCLVLAIPVDVLVHHVWTLLSFAEKLSSRFVCRRFRIVGGLSIKRISRLQFEKSVVASVKMNWESVTTELSVAFPHLEVVNAAANKVHLVICALGPRIACIKKLRIIEDSDGLPGVVDSHLLERFRNLTGFYYCGNVDSEPFQWLQGIGRNLKSLSMEFHCLMRVLSFVPKLEKLRVKIPPCADRGNMGMRQEGNANENALLVALATLCLRLRKLKTRIEGASIDALDKFLTNCVFLEHVEIDPVCNSVLLTKLPHLRHLHTVCSGNIFRAEELRLLILSGFQPKHVSLRQGALGLRGTVLDKLSCCAESLTSVTIELPSCRELTRIVDACGAFLKTLVIKGEVKDLKDLRHDSGGMARMWARLCKLDSFGCAYLVGCRVFSSEILRILEVSFDSGNVACQALLSIGGQLANLSHLRIERQPVTMLPQIREVCGGPQHFPQLVFFSFIFDISGEESDKKYLLQIAQQRRPLLRVVIL